MMAARIGPIGKVNPPNCAAAVADATGSPLMTLASTAAERDAPRDPRVVAAAVNITGSAAEPSPVPPDAGNDTDDLSIAELCCAGAATARERATAGWLPVDAADAGAERGPRTPDRAAAADPSRDAPRVTDVDEADSADPVVSASAAGAEANTEPIPNMTASAPTRPTVRT